MRELDVLYSKLTERGIPCSRLNLHGEVPDAIRIPMDRGRVMSVVQHRFSMGGDRNRLEFAVLHFRGRKASRRIDSVTGYLTADEALDLIQGELSGVSP